MPLPPRWTLVLLAALLAACTDVPAETPSPPSSEARPAALAETVRLQGVTLDARQPPPPSLMPEIAALGATHVAVIPFGFQRRTDDPGFRTNYDADWYTEGDRGIRALARQADTLGLRLVLKPQVWIGSHDPEQWSANIGFETEADWAAWEASYRDFALHYARLSAEIDAPLLVIGTELARAVREREAFWRGLIAEIRAVYDGQITYAANWYDDFEHVPFWDALDAIGIQAYFPLTEADAPTVADLRAGWEQHERAIEAVHRRTGKPVLFTEVGYRDVPFAAARPWEWPDRHTPTLEPDEALQARLYEAFFEEVWPEPWMAGAILWKWHPPSDRSRVGDFTPQGKPAEAVIRREFGGGAD
ncbi:MAG: hypothetical protein ABJF88_00840 [Rhodothermales bacterium]